MVARMATTTRRPAAARSRPARYHRAGTATPRAAAGRVTCAPEPKYGKDNRRMSSRPPTTAPT